jgi:hypothetical protein
MRPLLAGSGFMTYVYALSRIHEVCGSKELWEKAEQETLAAEVGMATVKLAIRLRIRAFIFFAALLMAGLSPLSDCRADAPGEDLSKAPGLSDPEKKFGIQVLSLRPTALGQMLDLRFKVLDPEKAKPILDKNKKSYLLDQKSGKTLPVPVTKSGSMRQTTLKPEAGRVYFTLFTNPGGIVKENSQVTLVVGDFKKSDIIVKNSEADRVTP